MKENYVYPVIFDYSESEYVNIILPDFGGATSSALKDSDIVKEAQDFLALNIVDFEQDSKKLPDPTTEIVINQTQKLIFINVWMPYHRSTVKEVLVKKTLTIPSWLDILAKQENTNFSAVLVKALKEKLNILN